MPVLLNNICPGKHHSGYGISSGKLWKLRAAVNYALASGKLVQVQLFVFALDWLCEGAATLLGQVNRNLSIIRHLTYCLKFSHPWPSKNFPLHTVQHI